MSTNLQGIVEISLAEITEIGAKIAALAEQAKQARLDALTPFLDALAKSGTVSVITVRGYTPGFNDGEPCEHSYDTYVNIADHADTEIDVDGEPDIYALYENLESTYRGKEGWADRNQAAAAAIGHIYRRPDQAVMQAIETLITATVEETHETGYQVSYVLKNGVFEIHDGEYDCGY